MSKACHKNPKKQRVYNKGQKFFNNVSQDKSSKARRFMDTKSTLRQGALAQRRKNFKVDQFPLAAEATIKAAAAPRRHRDFSRNRQFNVNKRIEASAGQNNNNVNGVSFTVKKTMQEAKAGPKPRPQTLDSLFASMKEQRMRALSRQNNGSRRNFGGSRRNFGS
ncbi:Unknown protein [Striga hermonthica]|uniref:Uncharacterized protein n=1 Tax=Striga hermonthica TaxID=68872 RepID=A0A9N7MTD0_STRHE|nr:Unknown protein [Striga hermonthica]